MKKTVFALIFALLLSLCACGQRTPAADYTVGICNYVDDASLNQIVASMEEQLAKSGADIAIRYDNCHGDPAVLEQIAANFLADQVDLMIAVATPVALKFQAATEGTDIPVVFAAVSDPAGAGLTDSPNVTGTSDYLDTNAVLDLMLALDPDLETVGLLYDPGQDSSVLPIAHARQRLQELGIAVAEGTGNTTEEIRLAAQALFADGVEAVFTPTDNTVMTAELAIYESFLEAGVPHFTGADSFALNGAFLGYGVDYEELGRETADMALEILLEGKRPADLEIRTFDNGTATVNLEACRALGYAYEELEQVFAPHCTKVQPIETAEEFE